MKNIYLKKWLISSSLLLACANISADTLSLATKPLYTGTSEAPMMMLVMGRDHTLYYEAYNDAADLDGDGIIDIRFMPDYAYEGYFDPAKCYDYSSGVFEPKTQATTDNNICITNSDYWSGNFLNYLTMTRMDVLRKVLFGGTRSTDSETETILERVFVPQDAHSWAKSYTSETIDGYDLRQYTPYELPNNNTAHFFGTVTYTGYGEDPILRVRENINVSADDAGVWDWASTERPVLNATGDDYIVRAEVCVDSNGDDGDSLLESNCQLYPNGQYKPTGLLHDYGESDEMLFGLMTGSYNKNLSGGVLRKAIGEFSGEVDSSTGQFDASTDGIISTINKLMIHGFRYSDKAYQTNCGWIPNRAITEGECASWGNPIGEILYEAMRYYSGASAASTSYSYSSSSLGYDESFNLPEATWDDPYSLRGTCANPNILLISDINPSYDSDQLPGAYSQFAATYTGSILQDDSGQNFSITSLLNTISTAEGKNTGEYFIGQSGTTNDGAPTVKSISGLESIRGLAPAEPTKEGSYSSAGVAYFGLNNDIHSGKDSEQNVTTMVVSLASNLPEIIVDVDGSEIKIVPFAKTVDGSYGGNVDHSEGSFQATNTIVDWYVEEISSTKGVFRINYEDVEQGADHDMDMIVTYTYEVKDNLCVAYNDDGSCNTTGKGVEISLDSSYAAGSFEQHAGYIISGTTNDGVYLEVRDNDTSEAGATQYYLDTPSMTVFDNRKISGSTEIIGLTSTRNFLPSSADAAEFLPSPLWYAAKWGGFADSNGTNTPDLDSEWDTDLDGDPDNYFPVTNAGELKEQISAAFDLAYNASISSSSAVFASNYLEVDTYVYGSEFEEETWSGDVVAYTAGTNFPTTATEQWSAADKLDLMTYTNRKIYSRRNDGSDTVFEFTEPTSRQDVGALTDEQINSLYGDASLRNREKLNYLKAAVNYIRGDRSNEGDGTTYEFRARSSVLGDVINGVPYYVGTANSHDVEKEVLVYGANDGMVHIVEADSGEELVAYIPSVVYDALGNLVDESYIHEYSVDGGITGYTDDSGDTTVIGRLGLGKQGLYAIDVSDLRTVDASMMLWEINTSTTGYDGLGYTTTAPSMVKVATGDIAVVFENGYNSSDDDAAIYFADSTDGSLIKKLTVGTVTDPSGLDRPNALAHPAIVDNDGDGVADRLYAGDLFGNLWVFDISDSDPNNWALATTGSAPLFQAYSPTVDNGSYMPQSITVRPSVTRHSDGTSLLIAFGTGKYVEADDASGDDQATQSFYVITDYLDGSVLTADRETTNSGIFENSGNSADLLDNLQYQAIEKESDTNRLISSNLVDWNVVSGFYIDLINTANSNTDNDGERVVVPSSIFSNQITFVTLIPSEDVCVAGGTGWYMQFNLDTGQVWNAGTTYTDDPATTVDESIPTDNSTSSFSGIATSISTAISVETDSNGNVINAVGNTYLGTTEGTEVIDGDEIATGRLSWRRLY